jgi:hypothetical protein
MGNIAVEGLENDIVPLLCRILKQGGYQVGYRNESAYFAKKSDLADAIVSSNPDIAIVCNSQANYIPLVEALSKTKVPVIVLTGGGPDFEEKAAKYTAHILRVPFEIRQLYDKVDEALGKKS